MPLQFQIASVPEFLLIDTPGSLALYAARARGPVDDTRSRLGGFAPVAQWRKGRDANAY